ncbi:MAG: hypothetical protein LBC68_07445 [Prevotellaceae bacterium]|jgi:hypothetical protein|nr:hypothetical protein [Prevotellaceae bacterium]
MLVLKCKILIEGKDNKKITFEYVSSAEIVTSVENLTDTAKIVVPRKLKWKEKPLTDFINRGDAISVELGYDGHAMEAVFTGYIRNFTSRTTITLDCENEMWKLKQIAVAPKVYKNFDIKAFIQEYAPHLELIAINETKYNFGEVKIENDVNVARVLEQLKQNNPFYSFFRGKKLYAVIGQTNLVAENEVKTLNFIAHKNIITSEQLKLTLAEDVNVRVKAISILPDNKRLVVEVPQGKKDGDLRTLHASRYKTEADLKKYAEQELAKLKTDTVEGNFTAFGIPYVRKGDRIKITDTVNADISGKTFAVRAVKYGFDDKGYRQTITLGHKY